MSIFPLGGLLFAARPATHMQHGLHIMLIQAIAWGTPVSRFAKQTMPTVSRIIFPSSANATSSAPCCARNYALRLFASVSGLSLDNK